MRKTKQYERVISEDGIDVYPEVEYSKMFRLVPHLFANVLYLVLSSPEFHLNFTWLNAEKCNAHYPLQLHTHEYPGCSLSDPIKSKNKIEKA